MSFGSFVRSIGAGIAKGWNAVKGTSEVAQAEALAVATLEEAFDKFTDKYLVEGSAADKVIDALIHQLAVAMVAKMQTGKK